MRLWDSLAQQFRQPTGLVGRLVGFLFRINREGIDWTMEQLEIQPTDHVLEIGFGPGYGIQRAASLATQGRVAGVDFSQTMLEQATRRNAVAIDEGLVELCLGDATALLYPDNTFHKVFATNVIYFWTDPLANLRELHRVMKPRPPCRVRHCKKTPEVQTHPNQRVSALLRRGLGAVLPKLDFTMHDSSLNRNVSAPAFARRRKVISHQSVPATQLRRWAVEGQITI
jgi:ubiquinone/menaquinone biosynthesis C-methylase UbiE